MAVAVWCAVQVITSTIRIIIVILFYDFLLETPADCIASRRIPTTQTRLFAITKNIEIEILRILIKRLQVAI